MSVNLSNALVETQETGNWIWQHAVIEFGFDGEVYEAEIIERHQKNSWSGSKRDGKDFYAKGRLYIDTYYAGHEAEITYPLDEQLFGTKPEDEFSRRGLNVDNDKAWDRYNRNWTKVSKAIAFKALETVNVHLDKATFSRKAGCSMCPCSPGWIVDGTTNMTLSVSIQPRGTYEAKLAAKAAKNMAIAGCI